MGLLFFFKKCAWVFSPTKFGMFSLPECICIQKLSVQCSLSLVINFKGFNREHDLPAKDLACDTSLHY